MSVSLYHTYAICAHRISGIKACLSLKNYRKVVFAFALLLNLHLLVMKTFEYHPVCFLIDAEHKESHKKIILEDQEYFSNQL
jgi:hypothetical protein